MSASSPTSGNSQSWSGPGIIQSYIKLRDDSKISQETLEKWVYDVYLPAVLKTGIVKAITSWRAASAKYERGWLIVFDVEDLELVQYGNRKHVGGGLHVISRTSDMFWTNGPVDDVIDFESRILEKVELYGDGRDSAGASQCFAKKGSSLLLDACSTSTVVNLG
ncbi:uncharacterized protein N0V89_002445 [Didymosphaeria variabile]|uniref:Uncharacterized protein n=1 Tax=Didymosphaeria variabile TaxID=1932322 RepID=A0A9W8XTI4_9PLEO|nr:uncharacterized protein N0V89_002445 [Didymosphaeria variabile]KAJ4357868.1 hypothetical protein N0V89_002445 [Didymosphaeria variabile]